VVGGGGDHGTDATQSDATAAGADPPGQLLHPDDMETVIGRYQRRIAEHGPTFQSQASGTIDTQRARQEMHASAVVGHRPRVLDIGCGVGSFYEHLQAQRPDCDYTGYDIVPEYVDSCRRRYPAAAFLLRNALADGIEGIFDCVVMSQVLNNRYRKSDNTEIMQEAIGLALSHARRSVSVDMMSSFVDYENPDLFYYHPADILNFAKSLTPWVVLRHDYLPFEFCIQLFHAPPGSRAE